jgi:hypothetical protein
VENRCSSGSHKPASVGSTPTPATIKCANFIDPAGARQTAEEYHRRWGAPGEPCPYDLSDANLLRQCGICPFGIPKVSEVMEAVGVATGDLGARLQQDVKRLTGEPLKRVCFKELKEVPHELET